MRSTRCPNSGVPIIEKKGSIPTYSEAARGVSCRASIRNFCAKVRKGKMPEYHVTHIATISQNDALNLNASRKEILRGCSSSPKS